MLFIIFRISPYAIEYNIIRSNTKPLKKIENVELLLWIMLLISICENNLF